LKEQILLAIPTAIPILLFTRIDGKRTGNGKLTLEDGSFYEGEFVDGNLKKGKIVGVGKEQIVAEGTFDENGKIIDGTLSKSYPEKTIFMGYKNGALGYTFIGNMVDGKPSGVAELSWPSGSRYVGDFDGWQRTGRGTYYWTDGTNYCGDFKNGKIEGFGIMTWSNGVEYIGDFKDGVADGCGKKTWSDGSEYNGNFKDGAPDGFGKKTYPDGKVEHGWWHNNEFIGWDE
jgi:hypothetical protein